MSKKTFAANITKFITAFNFTEKEVLCELDISYERFRQWRIAEAYPKLEMMVKICDFFCFRDIYRLVNEDMDINEIKNHAKNVRSQVRSKQEQAA